MRGRTWKEATILSHLSLKENPLFILTPSKEKDKNFACKIKNRVLFFFKKKINLFLNLKGFFLIFKWNQVDF